MPILEIAVAARDFGPGQAQEGDVIGVRFPKGVIGAQEGKDFLWLTVDVNLTREAISKREPGVRADIT